MAGYPAAYGAEDQHPTRTEIASNFALWQEYCDPHGHTTREEFDAMTVEEKVQFQRKMWPHDLKD